MKNLKQVIPLILFTAVTVHVNAQAKDKVVESNEVKVIMVKDDNGDITKINKSFSIDDKEELDKLLKENGIELNVDDLKGNYNLEIDESIKDGEQDVIVKVLKEEGMDGKVEIEKDIRVYKFKSDDSSSEVDEELVEELKKAAEEGDVKKIMELTGSGSKEQRMIYLNDEDIDYKAGDKKVIVKTYEISSDENGDKTNGTMIFLRKESIIKNTDELPTQIEENFGKNSSIKDLKLFPNPTNYNFNMSFISKEPQDYNLSITDAKGSKIFEKELINFKGNFNEDFDLSKYDNGVYFFNLISDEEKISKQIIVQ